MTAFVEAVVPLLWRKGTLRLAMAMCWHCLRRLNMLWRSQRLLRRTLLLDRACVFSYKLWPLIANRLSTLLVPEDANGARLSFPSPEP